MHLKTKNKSSIKGLRSLLLTGAAALTLALTACGGSQAASPDDGRFKTVATVGMIADIVRNVAGDKTEVIGLIGEGVDPHQYRPTRGDIIALSQADIVFYGGLMLEGKMGDVLARIADSGKPIYPISEKIRESGYSVMSGERTDDRTEFDPHLWMDVGAWRNGVKIIRDLLAEFDPENADFYRKNAASYMEKLKNLDNYVNEVISTIPENQRFLITAHDAFYYMGRAYEIEVRGIQGINTSSEAGVKDIENLVSFLVENKIPAVFVETSVSDKNVRALVEGARSRGHNLIIGGSLFSDAMGSPGTYEGTYIGMLDHNATIIARAL